LASCIVTFLFSLATAVPLGLWERSEELAGLAAEAPA
jgi:hypothetical protein